MIDLNGRGGGIRTPDPLLPKQMRYQAALRPDSFSIVSQANSARRQPTPHRGLSRVRKPLNHECDYQDRRQEYRQQNSAYEP